MNATATAATATQVATTVLPATLVEVPATVAYELKRYSRDEHGGREGAVEHVDLYRDGKAVARAYNRGDGGGSSIEIIAKGLEAHRAEREILGRWIDDFTAAGLQYHVEIPSMGYSDDRPYTEEHVADVLLFEALAAKDLSRKRSPHFADSLAAAKAGVYFSLKGSAGASPAQIQDFLDRNPGVVVWSKTAQEWTGKVA